MLEEWMRNRNRHPMYGERLNDDSYRSIWDDGAQSYTGVWYSEISKKIVDRLKSKHMLDGSILDIACGPGIYTLLFGRICSSVYALDFSEPMLDRLRMVCREEGLSNVTAVQCDCRIIPPDIHCDTAFCSLCPTMNDPELIIGMERYGDRCAYVSSKGGGSLETEVWKELGCDYSYSGYDPEYPFAYLKERGRAPSLDYFTQTVEQTTETESVERSLLHTISIYREIGDKEKKAVRDVVLSHSSDNFVKQRRKVRMGLICWDSEV